MDALNTFNPDDVTTQQLPTAIGRLEAYKAALWHRLTVAAPVVETPQEPPVTLLTAPEIATRLGVTTARVYELIRSGDLPAVHVGRYRRVHPAAFERWLRTRQKGA